MVGAKHLPAARRMPDSPEGKVTFDMHHSADRRQVLRQHPGGRFVEKLVAGADTKAFCAGFVQKLLRIFDGFGERLFDVNMAAGLERHACERGMGRRRSDDMDDVKFFRGEQLFRRLEAADSRYNIAHGSLSRIGGIGHRNQLHAGASQDGPGMVLRMAARADERDPQGS